MPIRSSDFQLANEFSEYFLLKFKRITDVFENILDFPVLSFTNFTEMNKEEILCIVRPVYKTNYASDPFKKREMTPEIILDPITTIFTDKVNSSF